MFEKKELFQNFRNSSLFSFFLIQKIIHGLFQIDFRELIFLKFVTALFLPFLICYTLNLGSGALPSKMLDLASRIIENNLERYFFLFLAPAGGSNPAVPSQILFLTLWG